MKRILVIGATSFIGERACRLWAARSTRLFLAARDTERLGQVSADLRLRGAAEVATAGFEALSMPSHGTLIADAWRWHGGFDVVLIAHGSLPPQRQADPDGAETAEHFAINATSTVNLMTLVAEKLEAQGSGMLVVISSVAGDRGRASSGIYGAAKAAVTAYCSVLRQRLHRRGVIVLTVKPGFVDTPMTASFRKGLLWASPEKVAADIVRAVDRQRLVCYTPWFWRWILLVVRLVPERIFVSLRF